MAMARRVHVPSLPAPTSTPCVEAHSPWTPLLASAPRMAAACTVLGVCTTASRHTMTHTTGCLKGPPPARWAAGRVHSPHKAWKSLTSEFMFAEGMVMFDPLRLEFELRKAQGPVLSTFVAAAVLLGVRDMQLQRVRGQMFDDMMERYSLCNAVCQAT